MSYENSSVRRLGYLLDRAGYVRQAKALESFVKKAKTVVPLDPAVKQAAVQAIVAANDKGLAGRVVLPILPATCYLQEAVLAGVGAATSAYALSLQLE
jgi:hypothetical protein